MFSTRPSRAVPPPATRRVAAAWIHAVAMALAVASALGATGCKRSRTAHLVVVNTSERSWRVALTSVAGSEPRQWDIEPRQTVETEVPAGDYEVEQVLLTSGGGAVETRRLAARFERGQDYRWQLATLLSDSP